MDFYHEGRALMARYSVDAPLPAAAVSLGWKALLREHPSPPARGRLSMFERAARTGGRDASGWVLYRIARTTDGGAS